MVCFPKTLDICWTSVRPGTDAKAWVARAHKAHHTRRTSSLRFTAIVTGLDTSFWSHSSSPLVTPFHNSFTHRTNSSSHRKRQKVRVKISFGIIAWEETTKLTFSFIINICLQAMHNSGGCSYDSYVLNTMFWGSGGLLLHAFTSTVSWLWYWKIAYADSVLKAGRERQGVIEKVMERNWQRWDRELREGVL